MTHSRFHFTRRDFLKTTAAGTAAIAAPGQARAQAYPSRPITLLSPWPAGGSTGDVMRACAESAG